MLDGEQYRSICADEHSFSSGEDVPEEMLAELGRCEDMLKVKKGLLEDVRAAKKREAKRAAAARKKEERAEEERRMELELDEGDPSDTESIRTDSEASISPKPRAKPLVPDWLATPLNLKRSASADYEDSPAKKIAVQLSTVTADPVYQKLDKGISAEDAATSLGSSATLPPPLTAP